jgi:NADPH-dependent F420 reductase
MTIGIIGTGNVGSAIGLHLANLDYKVIFGSRNPTSRKMLDLLQQSAGNAEAQSVKETIQQADVVFLAVPWDKTEEIIKSVEDWKGKILIDCTNPLKSDYTGLVDIATPSAAEQIAKWAKGADVVKAFNSIGSQVMAHPQYGTDRAVLFICGNNETSKQTVRTIGEEMGFDVVDTGSLASARYLEQMAMFWIHMAFRQGLGSDFALKILKR